MAMWAWPVTIVFFYGIRQSTILALGRSAAERLAAIEALHGIGVRGMWLHSIYNNNITTGEREEPYRGLRCESERKRYR